MGFRVGNLEFEKNVDGDICITQDNGAMFVLTVDEWISVITAMSYKPENADQHAQAEKFHLGDK